MKTGAVLRANLHDRINFIGFSLASSVSSGFLCLELFTGAAEELLRWERSCYPDMHSLDAHNHHCGDFEEPQPNRARFGKYGALQCNATAAGLPTDKRRWKTASVTGCLPFAVAGVESLKGRLQKGFDAFVAGKSEDAMKAGLLFESVIGNAGIVCVALVW